MDTVSTPPFQGNLPLHAALFPSSLPRASRSQPRDTIDMPQSMLLPRHRLITVVFFPIGVVEVVNSGCGGPQQLMVSPGEFTSGNFPGNYDNGKSCSWKITVEANKVKKKKVATVTS